MSVQIYFLLIFSIQFNEGFIFNKNITGLILDLSRPIDFESFAWPATRNFSYTKEIGEVQPDGSWIAMKEFCLGEHGGTHIDAPYHFSKNGWKLGDIPFERFFAEGVVIDISKEVDRTGPETELSENHLKTWENRNGLIPEASVTLVRFGWSKYYQNYTAYMGEGSQLSFPGISPSAARYLVKRKVYGVGVDVASLDKGSRTTSDVHKILLTNSIYGLENVNIPDTLPARGFSLIIMPINLKFGTGGPTRIIAYPRNAFHSYL